MRPTRILRGKLRFERMTSYKVGTVVDFIAKGETPNTWRMVLIEEGPWDEIENELRRLQNRLYDCLDAALDGQLYNKFPATKGMIITLQLDGYNLPEKEVSDFFEAFSANVLNIEDYEIAIKGNEFVNGFEFKLNLESL